MSYLKERLISSTIGAVAFGAFLLAGPAFAYEGTSDDFIQIDQPLAKYGNDLNTGDGGAEATNFGPDGVWQDPGVCLTGRDQIAARLGGHHPGGVPARS